MITSGFAGVLMAAQGYANVEAARMVPSLWLGWFYTWPSTGTAEIFNAPELTRDTPPITLRAFLDGAGRNDCEPVVRHRYPAVAAAPVFRSLRLTESTISLLLMSARSVPGCHVVGSQVYRP